MNAINRILLPTDFSESGKAAYRYAVRFTERFGGIVDMLHVMPTLRYFHESMDRVGYPLDIDESKEPDFLENCEMKLRKELEDNIPESIRGKAIVKIGPKASRLIAEYAEQFDYDLILMSTVGNSGEQVISLGSCTQNVIRHSNVPVLSVRESFEREVRNVLVPVDFSDASLQALHPAATMAARLGSGITLFHVIELYQADVDTQPDEPGTSTSSAANRKVQDLVNRYLEKHPQKGMSLSEKDGKNVLAYRHNGESYEIPLHIESHRAISAHYEIVDYANQHADMVVISTHGRTGLSHLFLGSTAEKVVQGAEPPVLTRRVVPEKEQQ